MIIRSSFLLRRSIVNLIVVLIQLLFLLLLQFNPGISERFRKMIIHCIKKKKKKHIWQINIDVEAQENDFAVVVHLFDA